MQVALDTNILAYAEGVGDTARHVKALRLVEQLPAERVLLPAQTLGELYRVLTGKANRDPAAARNAIMSWADCFEVADSSWLSFQTAFDLAIDHGLQIWDALIMSVASENQCRMLLSEDLQDNFTWHGLTVINPFGDTHSPLLENFLESGG